MTMKKGLRFIIALLLMAGVGALTFLPVLSIASLNIAVKDMILLAFNQLAGLEALQEVGVLVQSYISPFGYVLIGGLVLAALLAILIMILGGKKPYILSIFGLIALNGYIGGLVYFLYDKFQNLAQGVAFYQLEGGLVFSWLLVILWAVVNIVMVVLAIVGIRLNGQDRQVEKEILMPESYPGSVAERLEEKEVVFQGALLGVAGQYLGLAYPLQGMQPVYIAEDDTGLYVSKQAPTTFLAQVQYDKTKQEYQLTVQALHTVHLDSGQPLGARLYYLPRGTQLHFISAQEELVLG